MISLIVFLVIVFTVIVALLISSYTEYLEITEGTPKIKFSTFCIFYDINPSRWVLGYSIVKCKIPRKDGCFTVYGKLFNTEESFAFNYIDTYRYRLWHKNLQTHQTNQSNYQSTARMLAAVKQDIADLEAQAQSEQNQAIEILRSVITNVKS